MLLFLFILAVWWSLCLLLLWLWKGELFKNTWQEPYFGDTPVLIESDDWGPGGASHIERLQGVSEMLANQRDSVGRPAVITADMVLAIPDIPAIKQSNPPEYKRKILDQGFPDLLQAIRESISQGVLVPQLHGLEHLNGEAFARLIRDQDPRLETIAAADEWWDWEQLDSPLQGHYVDGSRLPTTAIGIEKARKLIKQATATFERLFGHPSISSVAPCYLWNSDIESIWREAGIRYIQTGGYRCPGRDENGRYLQDRRLIRPGARSDADQRYLVRNVMYEPVDGRNTPETAYAEALRARRQALPITISTHRYNFTGDVREYLFSRDGLDRLLGQMTSQLRAVRFLSSPELGESLDSPQSPLKNRFDQTEWPPLGRLQGIGKLSAFLYRLRYRHPKLLLFTFASGLIIPAALLAWIGGLASFAARK
jgi:hypothetical protein